MLIKNHDDSSIYVGDLHPDITSGELHQILSDFGNVNEPKIIRKTRKYRPHCFAFCKYSERDNAAQAIEFLNNQLLRGQAIRVMWQYKDPSILTTKDTNIFIKNLDKTITQMELYKILSKFGKIISCKVPTDAYGRSKGHAFVNFESKESAQKCIEKMDGVTCVKQTLYVGPFIPDHKREKPVYLPVRNNLYLKNFGRDFTDDELRSIFSPFGEIKSACIMKDENGRSKGFGFVCFESPESAETALAKMCGCLLPSGHRLYVNWAQKKDERIEFLWKQRIAPNTTLLYVKNFAASVVEADLQAIFEKHGCIDSVKIVKDQNGKSRGFGYVRFLRPEDAQNALKLVNGTYLGTQILYVALVQRKEERRTMLNKHFAQSSLQIPPNPCCQTGALCRDESQNTRSHELEILGLLRKMSTLAVC